VSMVSDQLSSDLDVPRIDIRILCWCDKVWVWILHMIPMAFPKYVPTQIIQWICLELCEEDESQP